MIVMISYMEGKEIVKAYLWYYQALVTCRLVLQHNVGIW